MPCVCLQDLELPPEVTQPVAVAAESAAFAAPTPGVPPSQRWLQKGNLAADHVAAGAFDSAMRLLNRCPFFPMSVQFLIFMPGLDRMYCTL